jgi:LmbE family N-acetylglucosaminyl deacetylase
LSGLAKIETKAQGSDEQQERHRPEKIFYTIQAYDLKPDIIVDISESFEQKIEAMQAFSSQFFSGKNSGEGRQTFISTHGFLKFVEGRARDFGTQIGVEFGEGFQTEKIPAPKSLFDI